MSPWVPIVGVVAVVGAGFAAWKFLFQQDAGPTPFPVPPTPTPDDSETEKKKSQGQAPGGIPICQRTGKPYDADMFPDPTMVAALMIPLGYIPTPDLLGPQSKVEIKLFQERAIKLKLPGAGSRHGEMSPCTLVSLKAARQLFDAGKWDLSKARG